MYLGVGLPAAVERDELVQGIDSERVGLGVAQRVDRHPELGQVFRTMPAGGQMSFEPFEVPGRESSVEVVGHQRDRLAAHKCATSTQNLTRIPHPCRRRATAVDASVLR